MVPYPSFFRALIMVTLLDKNIYRTDRSHRLFCYGKPRDSHGLG